MTYCTGGIRCEKFSGWLVKEGFENVGQLHGGIATYGKDQKQKVSTGMAKCTSSMNVLVSMLTM